MSKKGRKHAQKSSKGRTDFSSFNWWRLANRLQLFLALVVPFLFLEDLYNWIELPRGVLIQVCAVLMLLMWLMGAISQNELRIMRTPFDLPLLGLVSWAGLSLLWAHNFYLGFEIWIQWSACLILFFLTVNLVQDERDIRRLLGAFALAGLVAALLGICQYLLEVKWVPQAVPPAATFANRNMAAQFMVVTIPLVAAFLLLSQRRLHVLLAVVALGFLGLFLFYTSTRSAWLAITLEFLLLALLLGRDRFKWKLVPPLGAEKKKALVICAMVVFILINLTPAGFQWQVGTAFNRIRQVLLWSQPRQVEVSDQVGQISVEDASQARSAPATVPRRDSISNRMRIWRNTFRMGTEHALKGVGVGNFPVFYPRYVRSSVVDPLFTERGQAVRAHNDYVQIFAELGVIGIFFLGWLLFALMKTSIALLGEETKGESRYLLMGVIVALGGFSVSAFWSFPFQMATPTFLFATYLGVLGGHDARRPLESEESLHPTAFISLSSWAATAGIAFTLLLLLILIPFQYNRLRADEYHKRANTAFYAGVWADVISQAKKASQYYPGRKDFLSTVGSAYFEMGNTDTAIETIEEFLTVYPYHMNAHHNVGVAYLKKGDLDRAFRHFDRALEIVPEYGKSHFFVAQIHEKRNELDKALDHYRLAVEDEHDNALFLGRLGNAALTKELFSEAKEAFEKALRKDADNSKYYLKLGIAAAQALEPEEAKAAFRKAAELDPESAEAHYNLGMILLVVFEEREEGIQHLEKTLSLEPFAPYASQARRLLESTHE